MDSSTSAAHTSPADSSGYPPRGHVTPGGPIARRELADVVIRKASVSDQDNNAYVITDRATGRQLLIDAADSPDAVLALIADAGTDGGAGLDVIVTTHQHWDHHRALSAVATATNAITAAGAADAAALPVAPDRELADGDQIELGATTLRVIALRGHTPGSVALLLQSTDGSRHLFTGDSLFPGGPGKTQTPQTFASLMDDLEERVFGVLPDSTWFYPGHGDDGTLGAERAQLGVWRARGW